MAWTHRRYAAFCSALGTTAVLLALLNPATAAPGVSPARPAPSDGHAVAVSPHSREARPTEVHWVSPTTASGTLRRGYRVTSTRHGYCWTVSNLNPALFRCFWKSEIQDPCWPEAGGASVLCLGRPWWRHVTRLRLTRRLPDPMAPRSALWGVTMASGNNCQFADGAREWFQGRSVSYYCGRRWVLVGAPDRSGPTWQMRAARRLHGRYHARGWHPLSEAWRAKRP